MDRTRLAGVGSMLGGVLAVLAAVPPRWYGSVPGDSYVFSPDPLSPLWIERTVVPVLAVLAVIGVGLGLLALLVRGWHRSRIHAGSGVVSLLGLTVLGLGLFALGLPWTRTTEPGVLRGLIGLAALLGGGFLLLVGTPLWGYVLLQDGRRPVGWALVGFVPASLALAVFVPDPLGGLAGSLPTAALGVAIALELDTVRAAFGPG